MIIMHNYLTVNDKLIAFTSQPDGYWIATCTCNVLNCSIRFPLTADEVSQLLLPDSQRLLIQHLLPNTSRWLREIFITGTTPAEFDLNVMGKLRPLRFYRKLGYEVWAD